MNAIEINQLSWKYNGSSKKALDDINLTIEENTFLGIIGPNEAGKTTLVSSIKGIIPNNYSGVFKGHVKIFGKELKKYNPIEISQMIGMVFSDPESQFTSMSVEEEIAFGLENMGYSYNEIKQRLEWVSELTSIEELLEKPPYDLSGGQKQRIAIASVLAMQPKIIILDEPTSMLDPFSKDYVFSLLKKMKDELNITIIVIEHNIEKIAELSDSILLMNDGKIKKFEPTEKFFNDIDYIESNGIKVPEAIKFIHYVYRYNDIYEDIPVKFEDIKKKLGEILRGGVNYEKEQNYSS